MLTRGSTGRSSPCGLGPPVNRSVSLQFMRVYNFQSAEHSLNNVSLSRIRVSRFSDVNDPFELLAVNVGGRKDVRKHLAEWRTSLNSREGLLCFSSDWKNPVLWSHYAAKHRGICLGFDLDDTLAKRVRYQSDRFVAKFDKPSVSEFELDSALVDELRCTKYTHWEYESEVRVFVDLEGRARESGSYFFPFGDQLALREVILGPLCDIPIESVRSLVTAMHSGAVVRKARLAFKWFQVVPDERFEPAG